MVAVPQSCERWVPVGSQEEGSNTFISVEELIKANLGSLFGGMEVWAGRELREKF